MPRHERFDALIETYGTAAWDTAMERLLTGIDTSGGPDACHPWTRSVMSNGYGQINIRIFGGTTTVHRLVHELEIGPVPQGYEVDHRCHNEDLACPGGKECYHRPCANWRHLEAVPPGENAARAARPRGKGKFKTHCSNNHPYDEENTAWVEVKGRKNPVRRCKACNREKAYRIKNGSERPADAMESLSRAGCSTCRRGHAYDELNTKYDKTTGKRRCRKCERLNDINSKRRKKGLEPLTELPES